MSKKINVWAEGSTGYRSDDDPEVVTVAWAVRGGIEILDAEVFEGGMLVVRLRVPADVQSDE